MSRWLVALLVLVGGCTHSTLNQVRESPPTRTAVLKSKSYQALAICVIRRLELSTTILTAEYRYVDSPKDSTATVAGATKVDADLAWFFEARFRQRDPDSVAVETRLGSWLLGRRIEPNAWDAINRCAGTLTEGSAPPSSR